MNVIIGGVYKTQLGNFLRLVSKGEVICNFLLVDSDNVPIEEKRNRFGHVVMRSKRQYGYETISSFKLIK